MPRAKPMILSATQLAEANDLAANNTGLAYKWARMNERRGAVMGMDFEDLMSIAGEALVKASRRFEPSRGNFSTFAFVVMNGALRHKHKVHESRAAHGFAFVPIDKVRGKDRQSLTVPVATDDLPGDPDRLKPALRSLTTFERDVLRRRFWGKQTLEQIGTEFDLSKETIRQVQGKALAKLRDFFGVKQPTKGVRYARKCVLRVS